MLHLPIVCPQVLLAKSERTELGNPTLSELTQCVDPIQKRGA